MLKFQTEPIDKLLQALNSKIEDKFPGEVIIVTPYRLGDPVAGLRSGYSLALERESSFISRGVTVYCTLSTDMYHILLGTTPLIQADPLKEVTSRFYHSPTRADTFDFDLALHIIYTFLCYSLLQVDEDATT